MTICYRFKRHPIPMVTHFRHSLVLAYALSAEVLAPLVPPGLAVDTYGDLGFIAVAFVQTERLRPTLFPAPIGRDFFLTGYRIFVRHHDASGRMRRGLHILPSDTDRRSMVVGGNALTHYNYRLAAIRFTERREELEIGLVAEHLGAQLAGLVVQPPEGTLILSDKVGFRGAAPRK